MVNRKEVTVKQIMYEDFAEFDNIEMATATEWWNGEGLDIYIQRKGMPDIQVSLTISDVSLFRKIFSDFDF